jgi:hypothetical protein
MAEAAFARAESLAGMAVNEATALKLRAVVELGNGYIELAKELRESR